MIVIAFVAVLVRWIIMFSSIGCAMGAIVHMWSPIVAIVVHVFVNLLLNLSNLLLYLRYTFAVSRILSLITSWWRGELGRNRTSRLSPSIWAVLVWRRFIVVW